MSETKTRTKSTLKWNGRACAREWPAPMLAVKSDLAVRADQGNTTAANEYLDSEEVLDQKVELLAEMIKASQHAVLYTGAGLSKAAGIPDYATKAANSLVAGKSLQSPLDAQPTLSHRVLAALQRRDHFHRWVQQNHDSLGQKANFPNRLVNSIHGDWYDPSNPVVQFSGSLRDDLFDDMLEWERKTDLCLVLGTSLSGMNADRMAESPAKRCSLPRAHKSRPLSPDELNETDCLGTVIINLQRTRLDDVASLRIWAKLDDVFQRLALKLGLSDDELTVDMPPLLPEEKDVYHLPRYCPKTGLKLAENQPDSNFVLDLRPGSKVRIAHPHAASSVANAPATIVRQRQRRDDDSDEEELAHITELRRRCGWRVCIKRPGKLDRVYVMGRWWIDEALTGQGEYVPIVNQ